MDTVTVLKAIADETRLRILALLYTAGDLCACEIEAVLRLTQSNASRHLSRLRAAGLLSDDRRGHWVHFQIAPTAFGRYPFVASAIDAARRDLPLVSADLDRLERYRSSAYTCETIREWASA